jgi:GWxTD domain-containing protein
MNLRSVVTIALSLLLAGNLVELRGQVEVSGVAPGEGDASLFLDVIGFASSNGTDSRVDVFVQVGFDLLSFVKKGDLYDASYEMTLSLFDSAETLVVEKLWTENVKGVSFDRTASPNAFSINQRSFQLHRGEYTLRVVLRDVESSASYTLNRKFKLPDYGERDFMVSGIMLLNRVNVVGEKRSITPNISANVGTSPDSFSVYLETYNKRNVDSALFSLGIIGAKSIVVASQDTLIRLKPGKSEHILRVIHGTLPIGNYRLTVTVRPPSAQSDDESMILAAASRMISARWFGLPRSVTDLDMAIEQLKYIARDAEASKFKEAKTSEEKMNAFMEFWKKRDPNPSTPRNEKMEEYYARVDYANKHFKHYLQGWRTDMGMVYIMFGPPNNVERHPFEVDTKPYEIWSYYDINYSFVFVDLTGFGDYRLETPIWDAWNRLRN